MNTGIGLHSGVWRIGHMVGRLLSMLSTQPKDFKELSELYGLSRLDR